MTPFLRNGREHYYIKFMYDGQRRYVNTGETDIYKAKAVAKRKRLAWVEAYESKCNVTMDQLEHWDFLRYSSDREDTKHFASSIGLHWRRLSEYFTDPSNITFDDLEGYILSRKQERRPNGTPAWTNATLKKHLTTLRRGLLIAKENKGFGSLNIPKNWPKLTVQGHVKGKRGASNDYSVDELKAMVALLQGHAQDEALFALCTGMRAGELENIRLEHFTPRTDMPGCAGTLYVPPGHEDHPRDVGVTHGMWAILQRALPFSIDHKRVYATAIKKVTGKSKFGLRDFRAGFISALAPIDTYGGHMAAGHTSGVMGRYHNWTPDRMATVALAAWGIFAPGGHGGQLGAKMGAIGYARKRLKS